MKINNNFETEVLLGDLDVFGIVYYLKYIEWCNIVREKHLLKEFPDDIKNFLPVVSEYSQKFFKHSKLGDKIYIEYKVIELKKTNFEIQFDVFKKINDSYENKELLCTQKQRIVYLNKDGRPVKIPHKTINCLIQIMN